VIARGAAEKHKLIRVLNQISTAATMKGPNARPQRPLLAGIEGPS
jgi:hypothetical protein